MSRAGLASARACVGHGGRRYFCIGLLGRVLRWDGTVYFREMRQPLIFDGRNLFEPATMLGYGFEYHSVGRPPVAI